MDPRTTVLEEINYSKYLSECRAESRRSSPPRIAYPFTTQRECKLLGSPTLNPTFSNGRIVCDIERMVIFLVVPT